MDICRAYAIWSSSVMEPKSGMVGVGWSWPMDMLMACSRSASSPTMASPDPAASPADSDWTCTIHTYAAEDSSSNSVQSF